MDLTIGSHYELLPRHWRGPRAQYIVFAGLVFVPLSNELLEALKVKKKTVGLTYKAEAQVLCCVGVCFTGGHLAKEPCVTLR